MSYDESQMFADCIDRAYLWGGTGAVIDAARHTHPQARQDKTKTRNFWRQLTAEQMASTQARLEQLDLAARNCEERKKKGILIDV